MKNIRAWVIKSLKPECWVITSLPGKLPDPGIELGSPVFQADALPAELPGKPLFSVGRKKSRCSDVFSLLLHLFLKMPPHLWDVRVCSVTHFYIESRSWMCGFEKEHHLKPKLCCKVEGFDLGAFASCQYCWWFGKHKIYVSCVYKVLTSKSENFTF